MVQTIISIPLGKNSASCGFDFLVLVLQFLEIQKATHRKQLTNHCPADGKIVIIKEVEEPEYFQDKRLQVSIFMSPLNVHVTRYPASGEIVLANITLGIFSRLASKIIRSK